MPENPIRERSPFDLRQPWLISLFLLVCIPLFPDYVTPFLAVGSLLAASRDARQQHRRLRVGTAGKAMLALIAYFAVGLIWADNRAFTAITCLGWIVMLLLYVSVSTVLTEPRRAEALLFMLSAVAGILGALACVQYAAVAFFGKDVTFTMAWYTVDRAIYDLFPFPMTLGSGFNRACATFPNPNMFAQYLVFVIPFTAAYGFSGRRNASKILARVSLLLATAGLLVTFSRGCYLALFAIAVVMCIANIRRLIPILTVLCSVLLLMPDTVYQRLSTLADATDVAILERFELWGVGMQLFTKAPLLGHGAGVACAMDALGQAGYNAPHLHNLFMQILVEGGIVGVFLLLFVVWKFFRTGFELIIHTPKTRMYGAAIIAFCTGFCVCGMFDYPLFTPKTAAMFMIVLGIADGLGFIQLRHPSCTVWQALPFYQPIHGRLEAWVQKKTAPKA